MAVYFYNYLVKKESALQAHYFAGNNCAKVIWSYFLRRVTAEVGSYVT
jgi:hypothetical protein